MRRNRYDWGAAAWLIFFAASDIEIEERTIVNVAWSVFFIRGREAQLRQTFLGVETMFGSAFDPANSLRYRRIALSLTFLLLAAVAIIALSPAQAPIVNVENDKLGHIVAFIALSLPCALAHPRSLFWLFPFIILFGAAIELIQPYVGRTSDLSDVYADILGAFLGAGGGLGLRWIGSRLCNGSVLG